MREYRRVISPQRNGETMKFLRLSAVILVTVFAAGTAFANDPTVIFDPGGGDPTATYQLIFNDTLNMVSWGTCDPTVNLALMNTSLASYINNPTNNGGNPIACMALQNWTGAPIGSLTLTIVTDLSSLTSINCLSIDNALTNSSCSLSSDGSTMYVNFSAGGMQVPAGNPPSNPEAFFIGEIGVNASDITSTTVWAPDYDPSSLVLLASGIGLLGLCAVRRHA